MSASLQIATVSALPNRTVPLARRIDGLGTAVLAIGQGGLLGGCVISEATGDTGLAQAREVWLLSVPGQANAWRAPDGDWRLLPVGLTEYTAIRGTVAGLTASAAATINALTQRHEGALDAVVRLAREVRSE